MRLSAGCAALALLAVAAALTPQADSRGRKLLSSTSEKTDATQDNLQPTFRPRSSRKPEESSLLPTRDAPRVRGRRPTQAPPVAGTREQTVNNGIERPELRKTYSRTRHRPVESRLSENNSQDNAPRSQIRFPSRNSRTSSTETPIQVSSEKTEVQFESNPSGTILNSTPKMDGATTQFRRRSFITQSTERDILPIRARDRYNIPRKNARSMDLMDSTNSVSTIEIGQTTAKSSEDSRNARKLRYRTRYSETDTNITGEGLSTPKEVQSSQFDNSTSQIITQNDDPVVISSTENILPKPTVNSFTEKAMRIIRRPITRGPSHYRPKENPSATKLSDDISEDDNYPESFKALLQAKSASTQSSSPPSESLLVKASQTVYTHSPSSQITHTDSGSKKYSRLRKRVEEKNEEITENVSTVSTSLKPPDSEYKRRVTFSPRTRKTSSYSSSNNASSGEKNSSSDKPSYKYSRKVKFTTTPLPKFNLKSKNKESESGSGLKKPLKRPTYFSRRKQAQNDELKVENSTLGSNDIKNSSVKPLKTSRTAFYSRYSRNKLSTTSSTTTEESIKQEKAVENSNSMPFLISLLSSTEKGDFSSSVETVGKSTENTNDVFIIAVTSKESQENNILSDNQVKQEEQGSKTFIGPFVTTPKYHANYKDEPITGSTTDVPSASPTIRNIQTKKQEQTRFTPSPEVSEVIKFNNRGRNSRKYADSYSKTTDMTTNGITPETEKPKGRFSSKFRASNIEKPFYKPTVPTVTPSTAWLKFFVTDNLLTKTVEEPIWFDEADLYTTQPMPREFITSTPYIHEPSYQLVEGEEIELGPDTKAFSITQTRRPLASDDLRLSEHLEKPHLVMNVEASNHSPSVTISIFDALAEILTSTPQTRLSSTTEVTPKPNHQNEVKESLIDVSSKTVNTSTGQGLTSQDLNTDTLSVQTTVNVINHSFTGENVTVPLNSQDETTPTLTPTIPIPASTSTVSARRPFGIKILYSSTEDPTDVLVSTPESKEQFITRSPVIETVSDILISNSNSVSLELTSMLTNNIQDILRNMNDQNKTQLTVDMAKILHSLIPKAMEKLKTVVEDDIVPNTTPYTLEEIKDTENVDLGSKPFIKDNYLLQSELSEMLVNSSVEAVSSSISNRLGEIVNNIKTESAFSSFVTTTTTEPSKLFNSTTLEATTSVSFNTDSDIDAENKKDSDPENKQLPLPFFTNSQVDDFKFNDSIKFDSNEILPIIKTAEIKSKDTTNDMITDSSDDESTVEISPIQLLILSKKAEVLNMIEELIKRHHDELMNITMTQKVTPTSDVLLSTRLTKIMQQINQSITSDSMNSMLMTKLESLDSDSISSHPVVPSTFSPLDAPSTKIPSDENLEIFVTMNTESVPLTTTDGILENNENFVKVTTVTNGLLNIINTGLVPSTIIANSSEDVATESLRENIENTEQFTTVANELSSENTTLASPIVTTEATQMTISTFDSLATSTNVPPSVENQETATITSTTTDYEIKNTVNVDTTTIGLLEPTTVIKTEAITMINGNSNISQSNPNTQHTIPKKDYVIFGILPNNTVVRKDPNENSLETLTEASPYIIYGVLPNNTVIRKFPNGTRVPRIMQKVEILPISPWSLKNPYSPIHNNPAIVRPKSNPIQVLTNSETSADNFNNGTKPKLISDTVNNLQNMIPPSTLNINDSSSYGVTTVTNKPPAEKSTASHVLSLRTSTMLPSVDEILLNSISSAVKEEMVISEMTTFTPVPRILTLDIDPETKMIRTEKPGDVNGSAIFKFIPVDEVSITPGDSNVLKITATKAPSTTTISTIIQTESQTMEPLSTTQITTTTEEIRPVFSTLPSTTTVLSDKISTTFEENDNPTTSSSNTITTPITTTFTLATTSKAPASSSAAIATDSTTLNIIDSVSRESNFPSTTLTSTSTSNVGEVKYENEVKFSNEDSTRQPKRINLSSETKSFEKFTTQSSLTKVKTNQEDLLKALLSAGNHQVTTSKSIEEDLKQLEEDTKFLKALLQVTGQNPKQVLPGLLNVNTVKIQQTTTNIPLTIPKTESTPTSTLSDSNLLQSILQAATTVQNKDLPNLPIITGVTSQIRINSDPRTTSVTSNPTTPTTNWPVYTSTQTLPSTNIPPRGSTVFLNTLQSETITEDVGISTTFVPRTRRPTTQRSIPTRRGPTRGFTTTTEMPSSSTFSVQEDLLFLQNLKTALKTNALNDDPETALANRIIALAVEKSLNEIQAGNQTVRTGKTISENSLNNIISTTPIITTTQRPTTTTTTSTTTTTPRPTTTTTEMSSTPSLEEDIKQFQEDTKLLQALIKATGQDPTKFNIPTLPSVITTTNVSSTQPIKIELASTPTLIKLSSSAQTGITTASVQNQTKLSLATTAKPFGARIVVKDHLKTPQDDAKLLKTLVTLQGVQETTTQPNKIALTGQSTDEALNKLINQKKPSVMVSAATKAPLSLSTEYGKSKDALLAALLKEQGFGPTTASSLVEQQRLSALLNQVVVTPKSRKPTAPSRLPPPPPPPAPRRPVLDGLAWLWQQWRETGPGPNGATARRPASTASTRPNTPPGAGLNWFGSGPFVGNADDSTSSNRVPLEPPRAAADQAPGRGQLVSAAINVTRAFSQFLGAAIQGAAQTMQSVFRAGQRAASDVYTNGSGGSG